MLKNRKKILLIAPVPPPFGGVAFIAKSLFDAGLRENFNVIHLNTSSGKLTENYGKITISSILKSINNLILLFILCLKNRKIDGALILGTNGPSVSRMALQILILRIFRIKIFTNLHGTRNYPKMVGLIKRLNAFVIDSSLLILSPTKADYNGLMLNLNQQNKVKLFYNSTYIPNKYFLNQSNKNTYKEIRIVGTGRFSKAKGAYDLFNICIQLLEEGYDIDLNWIGRGAFSEDDEYVDNKLLNIQEKYRKKIRINRDLSDEQKYQILSNSDIFILPSYTDNLPISILEAMAFGLPVISTNIGEIPKVVQNNINGWIIEPGDNKSLKNAIIKYIKNHESYQTMRDRNIQDYKNKFSTSLRISELITYI